jgi:hypothetical protein
MSRFTNEQYLDLLKKQGYGIHAPLATGVRYPQPEPAHREEPVCDDAAPPQGPARLIVCITRYSTGTLDRDNLWGGAKAVCDALRYSGFIPDDDPASIFLYVRQQKCKASQKGTEILILPLGEPVPDRGRTH